MFDLQATQKLAELFSISADKRDGAWQKSFYSAVPHASLRALNPQVIEGPDGFSYFALAFPKPHQDFESFSVTHILDFCLEHGFGVVLLDPPNQEPLWVFRYGDLSSYKWHQSFDGDPADDGAADEPVQLEALLPRAARQVMKGFLRKEAKVSAPAVAIYVNPALQPSRNLVFNFLRAQFSNVEECDRVMHQLLWFLPRSRGVVEATSSLVQSLLFTEM